jgi:hypothetical protein
VSTSADPSTSKRPRRIHGALLGHLISAKSVIIIQCRLVLISRNRAFYMICEQQRGITASTDQLPVSDTVIQRDFRPDALANIEDQVILGSSNDLSMLNSPFGRASGCEGLYTKRIPPAAPWSINSPALARAFPSISRLCTSRWHCFLIHCRSLILLSNRTRHDSDSDSYRRRLDGPLTVARPKSCT